MQCSSRAPPSILSFVFIAGLFEYYPLPPLVSSPVFKYLHSGTRISLSPLLLLLLLSGFLFGWKGVPI